MTSPAARAPSTGWAVSAPDSLLPAVAKGLAVSPGLERPWAPVRAESELLEEIRSGPLTGAVALIALGQRDLLSPPSLEPAGGILGHAAGTMSAPEDDWEEVGGMYSRQSSTARHSLR